LQQPAAEHDGRAADGGHRIVQKNQQGDCARAENKDDGSGGIPPSAHRHLQAEERGDGEREKADRGKDNVGEDAVKAAKQEDEQRHAGLQQDGISGRSKAWVQPSKDGEKRSITSHSIVNTRGSHGEGHEAAQYREQYAGREYLPARASKERLAELGDKGGVGDDVLERHYREERKADQKID